MKAKNILKALGLALVLVLITHSCFLFPTYEEEYIEEEKSISGDWQIIEAYRNEVDIFDKMDFTQFRLHFGDDDSFSIENYLPFIIDGSGSYFLDDPQYPFHITFINGNKEVETELNYPVVNGKRQIHLTFSPGCFQNVYVYVLEEVNP